MAAQTPEMSQSLERADDAAIVALALAKLQPRHREVLIASIYEEKSTDIVAAQMGLSENATRQLLFRARSAFKKALIGEADTAGLSVGQILSLAARKAAAESGKYISAAGAFLLVLAISIGVLPNISQPVAPVAEPAQTQSATEPEVMVEEETEVTQPVEEKWLLKWQFQLSRLLHQLQLLLLQLPLHQNQSLMSSHYLQFCKQTWHRLVTTPTPTPPLTSSLPDSGQAP